MMPYYKIRNQAKGSKATAWAWFAKYIKLRDAIKTTGLPDHARCVTCGIIYDMSYIEAGHAIPGRSGGILFDESIVYAQCKKCNKQGNGEVQAFKQFLVGLHGEDWYEMKKKARKTNTKLGDFECKLISDLYKEKYKELLHAYTNNG